MTNDVPQYKKRSVLMPIDNEGRTCYALAWQMRWGVIEWVMCRYPASVALAVRVPLARPPLSLNGAARTVRETHHGGWRCVSRTLPKGATGWK